jgi:nitrogen fixation NifU-like protein
MATELLKGKSLDDALALTNGEVLRALGGLPEAKVHCSVMAEEAVRAAIEDYRDKNGK